MARHDIDELVTSEAYLRHLARFRAMRDNLKPRIKSYLRMTEEQQAAWRAKDPLLDEVLDFCDRVSTGRRGDDKE